MVIGPVVVRAGNFPNSKKYPKHSELLNNNTKVNTQCSQISALLMSSYINKIFIKKY